MRRFFYYLISSKLLVLITISQLSGQTNGESTFKQVCSACHSIGKGRLVGPDLVNIDQRKSEDWVIRFVKSSQSVIKSGDSYADSLFKAYNQVIMPDQPSLSDIQIKEILTYISTESAAMAVTETAGTDASVTAVIGDIQRGKDLFVGNIRFANNGPTCNSCHNVNLEGFISGGVLAKDLTQSVSRLTYEGVKGVIAGLPFPQMKQSYLNQPLTEQEIADVSEFLKHTDEVAATQVASTVGNKMLMGGIGGVLILLILFSFFWIKRKQRTVNYSIYERQIKSTKQY